MITTNNKEIKCIENIAHYIDTVQEISKTKSYTSTIDILKKAKETKNPVTFNSYSEIIKSRLEQVNKINENNQLIQKFLEEKL